MRLRSADKEVQFQQAVYTPSWPKAVQEFTPKFFEESSKAWKSNKIEVAKGIYKYKKVEEPRRSTRLMEQQEKPSEVRRSPRLNKKN
jgi:hypothetical protein